MRRLVPFVLCLSACGGSKTKEAVTVEPLPSASATASQPHVSLPAPSMQAFLDAGCKPGADASLVDCTGASIPGIAKCRMPLHLLSVSFDPPAIVAECFVQNANGGLRHVGCMISSAVSLVVATPKGFVMIDTLGDLAKTFAPVTSSNEAIAFAVTATGSQFTQSAVGFAGPSSTQPTADGWRVRLFDHQICGCSHPTWAIDYAVTRDGAVKELSREVVSEDMNGLCVD